MERLHHRGDAGAASDHRDQPLAKGVAEGLEVGLDLLERDAVSRLEPVDVPRRLPLRVHLDEQVKRAELVVRADRVIRPGDALAVGHRRIEHDRAAHWQAQRDALRKPEPDHLAVVRLLPHAQHGDGQELCRKEAGRLRGVRGVGRWSIAAALLLRRGEGHEDAWNEHSGRTRLWSDSGATRRLGTTGGSMYAGGTANTRLTRALCLSTRLGEASA